MLHGTNFCVEDEKEWFSLVWYFLRSRTGTYLSSILHLLSLTLQCSLKSSNNLMHLRSCWHTDNAWLHVGKASTGYGSFSARKLEGFWWEYVHDFVSSIFNGYIRLFTLGSKRNHLKFCFLYVFFYLKNFIVRKVKCHFNLYIFPSLRHRP